ncbi:hypothetical protein BDP67DRAFT_190554 [Colletotrichum lupini]|nr:hypothetical protein BDP67DRAFT_190554 [Colletotrichum lupini]
MICWRSFYQCFFLLAYFYLRLFEPAGSGTMRQSRRRLMAVRYAWERGKLQEEEGGQGRGFTSLSIAQPHTTQPPGYGPGWWLDQPHSCPFSVFKCLKEEEDLQEVMEDLAIPSPLALNGYWAALLLFSAFCFSSPVTLLRAHHVVSARWEIPPKGSFFLDDEPEVGALAAHLAKTRPCSQTGRATCTTSFHTR